MSKYTVELRYIVENENLFPPSPSSLSLKNVLANYPLYIENYKDVTSGETINRREELNTKIINHYYFREIGFETVPMFLFRLQAKLNEIMKYYNQMYKSVDYEFNPLWNVDMTETFEHTINGIGTTSTTGTNTTTIDNTDIIDGTTTNTGTSSGDGLTVDSDTPQTGVTETDIKANTYASKTSYNKGGGTSSNTTDVNNTNTTNATNTLELDTSINSTDNKTENFTRREFGSSKGYTFAQNIEQWRNIMINVDSQIVEELNDLFMGIW